MTPATYFTAWLLVGLAFSLCICGLVGTIWSVLPADERGHETDSPRPWGFFAVSLSAIIVGAATLATLVEFWRQW